MGLVLFSIYGRADRPGPPFNNIRSGEEGDSSVIGSQMVSLYLTVACSNAVKDGGKCYIFLAIFIPWVPETPQLVRGGRGGEGALAFFAQLGFAQRREPCERERRDRGGGGETNNSRLSLSRSLSEPSLPPASV